MLGISNKYLAEKPYCGCPMASHFGKEWFNTRRICTHLVNSHGFEADAKADRYFIGRKKPYA
jgi:hypothetical protein